MSHHSPSDAIADLPLARRLVRDHGSRFRYVPEFGKWLEWNGQQWAPDVTGAIVRAAKQTLDVRGLELMPEASTEEGGRRLREWQRALQNSRIDGMVKLAATEDGIPVRVNELDSDGWLINCENGTVDLRDGTMRPHDPTNLCTKTARASYRPGAPCPNWLRFVNETFDGDSELIAFVQRASGLSVIGDASEQALLVAYGTGRNGKSTFFNTIRAALGDYAIQLAPDLLLATKYQQHPTGLADLLGVRLAITTEIEQGRHLAEALVKSLTGGEPIRARRMHHDFFEFMPTHSLWLVVNHLPAIRGADLGIWRRILVVPFTVTVPAPREDRRLPDKLWLERDGILTWMVEGCLASQEHGLQAPSSVQAASTAYRQAQDHLGAFIGACCEVGNGFTTSVPALRAAYEEWCATAGEEPVSQTAFGTSLSERGFPTTPDRRKRVGLALRPERLVQVAQVPR